MVAVWWERVPVHDDRIRRVIEYQQANYIQIFWVQRRYFDRTFESDDAGNQDKTGTDSKGWYFVDYGKTCAGYDGRDEGGTDYPIW